MVFMKIIQISAGMALLLTAGAATAHADAPKTRKECIKTHVEEARSEAGARLLGIACDELFRDYDFEMYMKEKGKRNGRSYTREELVDYAVTRGFLGREEASRRHEKHFREQEKKRLAKAACVLNLRDLRRARTDEAARKIFSGSDCLEAGN